MADGARRGCYHALMQTKHISLFGLAVAAVLCGCGDDEPEGSGGSGGTSSSSGSSSEGGSHASSTGSSDGGAGATGAAGSGGNGGAAGVSASADISGDGITGTATFTMVDTTVTFTVMVSGVMPEGSHAVHIHEFPDCSGDLSAAGMHWNPTNAAMHGVFDQGGHLGDIGDIPVMADGTGTLTVTTDLWSVAPEGQDVMKNVVGHSIIVHEMANADPGARMACGIIALD